MRVQDGGAQRNLLKTVTLMKRAPVIYGKNSSPLLIWDKYLRCKPRVSQNKRTWRHFLKLIKSASTWETRRQVLSVMSGEARYNTLRDYIPGLTSYRYSVANLHRLQFRSGAEVASQATHPCIRVMM